MRPQRGQRRIDDATDRLAQQHGFAKPKIRKVITELLQLYGGIEGWAFLEEGSYRMVLDKLMEEQAQQDQKQAAAGMEVSRVHGDAKGPSARSPCYGWISEESETESESEDGMLSDAEPVIFTKKDVPKPVETLPSKRKRPIRWDVKPNCLRD